MENAINKSRTTPNTSFVVLMMLSQCFFALYIRGCPSNVMELEADTEWAGYFASYIMLQIGILFLQRKCGSRFFIPKL